MPDNIVKKNFKIVSSNVETVVDVTSSEFQKYQITVSTKSYYLLNQDSETQKGKKENSHWMYGYGIAEVAVEEKEEWSYDHIANY